MHFFKGRRRIRPGISGQLSLCIFDTCLSLLGNLPRLLLHLNFIHFHLLNGPTLRGYCVELNYPTAFWTINYILQEALNNSIDQLSQTHPVSLPEYCTKLGVRSFYMSRIGWNIKGLGYCSEHFRTFGDLPDAGESYPDAEKHTAHM